MLLNRVIWPQHGLSAKINLPHKIGCIFWGIIQLLTRDCWCNLFHTEQYMIFISHFSYSAKHHTLLPMPCSVPPIFEAQKLICTTQFPDSRGSHRKQGGSHNSFSDRLHINYQNHILTRDSVRFPLITPFCRTNNNVTACWHLCFNRATTIIMDWTFVS